MQLSRQQKRAMLRRLNDKAKMSVVMDRLELANDKAIKEDNHIANVGKMVYTVLQWLLIGAIACWFVFA